MPLLPIEEGKAEIAAVHARSTEGHMLIRLLFSVFFLAAAVPASQAEVKKLTIYDDGVSCPANCDGLSTHVPLPPFCLTAGSWRFNPDERV